MRQIYYRGSIKFCNYSCAYCPFSKTGRSEKQLTRDKEQLQKFIRHMKEISFTGAVQIVPYGEALVHAHYWEGMAALSLMEGVEAVGAQSNFSFPVKKMMDIYRNCGGNTDKLRLWGTFHPDMTSVEEFLQQCRKLSEMGVSFCVGAVGVPEHLPLLSKLRNNLDPSVYMWINKMDGLGRSYSKEEKMAFLQIDEYFDLELRLFPANVNACQNSVFVEGDGSMHGCSLCHFSTGNLYTDGLYPGKKQACKRRNCDCFLAYGSRNDIPELFFFQPYPAFRIPGYKKAVFFDVDGTIVPVGQRMISPENAEKIRRLSRHSRIFLATALPYETAMGKVKPIADIIEGGVFAGGGRLRGRDWEEIKPLDGELLTPVEQCAATFGFRLRSYEKGKRLYKITLTGGKNLGELCRRLQELQTWIPFQFACEDGRVQLTAEGTGKLSGIQEICQREKFLETEIAVFGDSENDREMIEGIPCSLMVKNVT